MRTITLLNYSELSESAKATAIEEIREEMKEHENIPVPVLEEPVIETLSSIIVPVSSLSIIDEESKDDDNDHQDSIEQVQQLHEIKKKKRRMKGVRK